MTRQYPDRPIFGVGAVIFDDNKVLLVKRARTPLKGAWSLPGGAQKAGESVEEALHREIMEETGLKVEIERLAALIDIIDREDAGKVRHHYTVADYVCRVSGGTLRAGGDAGAVKWVRISELGALKLTPNAKEVIEAAWKS